MQNMEREGHIAAFFQGNPDPGTEDTFEFHQWPDHDRIEVTKHRDVVEFFIGRQGLEVTYKANTRSTRTSWTTTFAGATTRLRRR